jgi:hypothetical protein
LHVTPLIHGERDSKVILGFARVTRGILLTLCANACCTITHKQARTTRKEALTGEHMQGCKEALTGRHMQKCKKQKTIRGPLQ